jgi:hypothetical protein
MLFDLKEFEQFFAEKALKKGLNLFEKGKVEQVQKMPNGSHHFLINSDIHLSIKKKADAVISYTCDCEQKKYCEHLSAVLFYFQQEVLGIAVKQSAQKNKKALVKASANAETISFKHFLQTLEFTQLLDFIEQYADENPFFKELVKAHFSHKSESNAFDFYTIEIKLILQNVVTLQKLSQKNIAEICLKIHNLLARAAGLKSDFNEAFFLRLALINELPQMFEKRVTGSDAELANLHKDNLQLLNAYYKDGLNQEEKNCWIRVTELAIKTNAKLQYETYVFLIPRAACIINRRDDFIKLKSLLAKRSQKNYYTNYFNKLLIAQLQLEIKEAELFQTTFAEKKYSEEPELAIALADLSFCEGKVANGFKQLEKFYEQSKQTPSYFGYLDYIISKASEFNYTQIELKYLKESFINGLNIYPNYLNRFFELLRKEELTNEIDEVITKLRQKDKHYHFDKITSLLMKLNRWEDVIAEVKKQQNKFSILNLAALHTWPHYDSDFLDLYVKHFLEAVREARVVYYQEYIFKEAKKYIDKLPQAEAASVMDTILFKLGRNNPLAAYITKHYQAEQGKQNTVDSGSVKPN